MIINIFESFYHVASLEHPTRLSVIGPSGDKSTINLRPNNGQLTCGLFISVWWVKKRVLHNIFVAEQIWTFWPNSRRFSNFCFDLEFSVIGFSISDIINPGSQHRRTPICRILEYPRITHVRAS